MIKIIKRGGFREQAARQLKYKDSVNQRSNIDKQPVDQSLLNSVAIETIIQDENNATNVVHIGTRRSLAKK